MKTFIKNSVSRFKTPCGIALAASALMLASLPVEAQQSYSSSYVATGTGTNAPSVIGAAGTNVALVIDCRYQSSVTLQIDLLSNTNGAYAFAFPVQRSGDSVTYTATDTELITFTPTGYTNTFITNISTKGVGWLKFAWFTNSAGSSQTATITNISVKPILKRGVATMDRN